MPWAGLTAAAIIGRCQLLYLHSPPPLPPPSCHIVALSFTPCTHLFFMSLHGLLICPDLLTFSINHLASLICVRQTLCNMVCPRPVLAVVADRVLAGETLLTWLPRDTHDDLYSIMRSTWSRHPRQRPLMSEVLSRLQDLEAKLLQVGHLTLVLVVGILYCWLWVYAVSAAFVETGVLLLLPRVGVSAVVVCKHPCASPCARGGCAL